MVEDCTDSRESGESARPYLLVTLVYLTFDFLLKIYGTLRESVPVDSPDSNFNFDGPFHDPPSKTAAPDPSHASSQDGAAAAIFDARSAASDSDLDPALRLVRLCAGSFVVFPTTGRRSGGGRRGPLQRATATTTPTSRHVDAAS
jgi:hypothetical protein